MSEFLGTLDGTTSTVWRESIFLIGSMACGAAIGFFVRWMYFRYAATVSNRDTLSATFPLLMLATVLVIFVIKSSLALSLGLVGALSIVRFRAAIKEPEEIVYLFFCIAAGIALGARYYLFAVTGVIAFAGTVLLMHLLRRRGAIEQILLTITGRQEELFGGDLARFTATVAETVGRLKVQRFDVEAGQVQYRVTIYPDAADLGRLVGALQSRIPGCQISYVNLHGLL